MRRVRSGTCPTTPTPGPPGNWSTSSIGSRASPGPGSARSARCSSASPRWPTARCANCWRCSTSSRSPSSSTAARSSTGSGRASPRSSRRWPRPSTPTGRARAGCSAQVTRQRGPVTDQPPVAVGIPERALPMGAPGHLVVAHRVVTVRAGGHRAGDEGVRIIDEHLDPNGRAGQRARGLPAVVRRFAEEESVLRRSPDRRRRRGPRGGSRRGPARTSPRPPRPMAPRACN